jgi:AraC-like DNA-binding protein
VHARRAAKTHRKESGTALWDFREKVSEAIRAQLVNGGPSLWRTAEKVGTSVRTLQRRLDALGVTYRVLVGELRVKEASRLLRQTDLNVSVISATLGYADATAFSRAFRRQVGQTPREFRQARSRAWRV